VRIVHLYGTFIVYLHVVTMAVIEKWLWWQCIWSPNV